jgi:hypothetical protein
VIFRKKYIIVLFNKILPKAIIGGKMGNAGNSQSRKSRYLSYLAVIVGLVSLSCVVFPLSSILNRNQKPNKNDNSIQQLASTEEALSGEKIPTRVPVDETVDGVDIHYVYTKSVVTALYHLYGTIIDDFVDITLTNNGNDDLTFIVQSEIEGYTNQSSDTVDVPAGESMEIHQNPRLLEGAVDQLNSEKPGTFHIKVVKLEGGDEILLLDETEDVLMYSRRDFVWLEGFEWQEEYELWAAWVTPTDPKVEELIRAAADYTKTGTMWNGYAGYVNDENGGVWDRLQAIWQAEKDKYQLTYISTMTAFGPNTVQRMRLPAEVLDQSSGNCVELVTLFNSAAEALELESALVRIPGHVFSAIRMDEENADYYFVETTMIGQSSFEDAVNYGAKEWEDIKPHLDAGDEGYTWVNLPEMREKGILPIPWN